MHSLAQDAFIPQDAQGQSLRYNSYGCEVAVGFHCAASAESGTLDICLLQD